MRIEEDEMEPSFSPRDFVRSDYLLNMIDYLSPDAPSHNQTARYHSNAMHIQLETRTR
jgi:hypothetical protein